MADDPYIWSLYPPRGVVLWSKQGWSGLVSTNGFHHSAHGYVGNGLSCFPDHSGANTQIYVEEVLFGTGPGDWSSKTFCTPHQKATQSSYRWNMERKPWDMHITLYANSTIVANLIYEEYREVAPYSRDLGLPISNIGHPLSCRVSWGT